MSGTAVPTIDNALAQQRPYLLRFARARLRDAALVEDAVQDTLLAALQGYERFEQKSSLRTWLTGILLNKIADLLRREQRNGSAGDETIGDSDSDDERDEAVEWRDPERLLAGRQIVELVHRRLDRLPAQSARAFVLREVEGLSLGEIARELGVTASHSAVLVHRARSKLRSLAAGVA